MNQSTEIPPPETASVAGGPHEGPLLPGRRYPQLTTVGDALGALDPHEALVILFHDLALGWSSVPELVASAAYEATTRLPRGMALTDQRPGCWESELFLSMAPEDIAMQGPSATPRDITCPTCYADPDEPCYNTPDEAKATVAAFSEAELRAAWAVEFGDPDEYDPPITPYDMSTDLLEHLTYDVRRPGPHAERRDAAATATCYAGEWM